MMATSYGVGTNSCSLRVLPSNTQSRMASLAMWWPSDCDTPRKPSQRTGTMVWLSYSLDFFFDTASMSSPMRPIGHSDCTEMPLFSGNSSWISSTIFSSFLSPPKTMSFSWQSEVNRSEEHTSELQSQSNLTYPHLLFK